MKTLYAIQNQNKKIAVVGLGYVGLPLALEFAKKVPTIAKRFLLSDLISTKKNWVYTEKASTLQKKREMKPYKTQRCGLQTTRLI